MDPNLKNLNAPTALTPERRTGKARQSSSEADHGMAAAGREKPILETRAMRARRRSADRHRARPKDRRRAVGARLRRPDREPAQYRRQPAVGPAMGRRTRAGRHGTRQVAQPRRRGLMYLVDTSVVSEARRGAAEAVGWLRSVDPLAVHLSVITLGEIMRGVALKQKSDPQTASRL